MLRLIEGGRDATLMDDEAVRPDCRRDEDASRAGRRQGGRMRDAKPAKDDVGREAERRLALAGYPVWQIRERATGLSMPRELHYLALQISYAAEAISAQSPIPEDFAADCYWPG